MAKEVQRGQLSPKPEQEIYDYLDLIKRSGSPIRSMKGWAYKDQVNGQYMIKVDQLDFRKRV